MRERTPDGPLLAQYAYDKNGRCCETALANGTVTATAYHPLGGIAQLVTTRAGKTLQQMACTYDLDGSCLTRTENGRTTTAAYDAAGQLAREALQRLCSLLRMGHMGLLPV